MILTDIARGVKYRHKEKGVVVLVVAPHPDDGAYLIVEHYDEAEDEFGYFGCEASDLEPL